METISSRADTRRCPTVRPVAVRRTRFIAISRPLRSASSAGLRMRLRVWRRSVQLDRALAEGCPPAHCAQLELRAQQLASVRVRWALATGFRAVAAEAKRPPSPPSFAPIVLLALVAAHSHAAVPSGITDALLDIADALTEPGCTSVQAVARASWLLCDVSASPLYERLPPLTLQGLARDIAAALHGAP
jgi:hypothetical protein